MEKLNLFEVRKKAIEYCEGMSELSDEMKEVAYNAYLEGAKLASDLSNNSDRIKSEVIIKSVGCSSPRCESVDCLNKRC